MNTVTSANLKAKLEQLAALAALIDPRIALVEQGVNTLKGIFATNSELSTMLAQVYAETAETAPEIAQAVSAFVTAKGDEMEQSFKDHPGT